MFKQLEIIMTHSLIMNLLTMSNALISGGCVVHVMWHCVLL